MDSFERNMAYFGKELRDIKTSHAIALGSLDFYKKSGTVHTSGLFSAGIYIRLTVEPGERPDPYCQVFVRRVDDGIFWNILQAQSIAENGTVVQYYYIISEGDYEATAVSTSDFTLIVKEYQEGDWVGEKP